MPHYWKKGKDFYISRRSICANCGRIDCKDRDGKEECCKFFPPEGFVFVQCATCSKLYEVHETMKQDRADLCPECDAKESKEREERAKLPEPKKVKKRRKK